MVISTNILVPNILYSLILGLLCGAVFDCFRVFRAVLGVKDMQSEAKFDRFYKGKMKRLVGNTAGGALETVTVAICDFLFFTVFTVLFILFLYRFNFGRFRWFLLASCIGGFLLYRFTVGKLVKKIIGALSGVAGLIINFILMILIAPFAFAFRLFSGLCRPKIKSAGKKINKIIDNKKNRMYTLNGKRIKKDDRCI